jgi:hypothetical protein
MITAIYDWLVSPGIILMQLLTFVALCAWIAYSNRKFWQEMRRQEMRHAQARARAIEEIRLSAEDLAIRTEEIAREVKRETIERAAHATSELDTKIGSLLTRFDQVQQAQLAATSSQDIKVVIEDARDSKDKVP